MKKINLDLFKNILITGGCGFIGSTLIKKLLKESSANIINIDKLSYASNLDNLNKFITNKRIDKSRYHFYKLDLIKFQKLKKIISLHKPDLIFHLAAESHVDKSIINPRDFIDSNIIGTFNLMEVTRHYYEKLSLERKDIFKFIHVSTDEVFGSLGEKGLFNENTPYDPRSPYSASKASSDHIVSSWNSTYKIPTIITNCSNNFGPWQFNEKFIPLIINNALNNQIIPIYGNGLNIRDWLYVDDHINGLLLAASKGISGENYCFGGGNNITNKKLAILICDILTKLKPDNDFKSLIKFVKDRPGHDFRYAIDFSKAKNQLGWKPKESFERSLEKTIKWYLENYFKIN